MTLLSSSALIQAIREYNTDKIKELVPLTNLNQLEKGESPLSVCIALEDFNTLELLLNHGANLELSHTEGFKPLMEAESLKMVKFLIEKGANINAKQSSNKNVLEITINRLKYFKHNPKEDLKIIQYLLDSGVNYQHVDLNNYFFEKLSDDLKLKIIQLFNQTTEKNHLEKIISTDLSTKAKSIIKL